MFENEGKVRQRIINQPVRWNKLFGPVDLIGIGFYENPQFVQKLGEVTGVLKKINHLTHDLMGQGANMILSTQANNRAQNLLDNSREQIDNLTDYWIVAFIVLSAYSVYNMSNILREYYNQGKLFPGKGGNFSDKFISTFIVK